MPLITIRATPGAFTAESKARLVEAITNAACEAESLPAANRVRTIVIWEDLTDVYLGAQPAQELARLLLLDFVASDGVLDPVRREAFAHDVHWAALGEPADDRPVKTSVLFHDVPEGRWGRDGTIMRLPAMAAAAGFEHLKGLA
ncbi:tautomerase family protein [Actinocrispum sp. NPDC049592]|uniref:tautomerase family protein n=1 Tax=Actinocrispum sp. NPDC049592 TaxID=3154835 RepID=UPI0034333EF6